MGYLIVIIMVLVMFVWQPYPRSYALYEVSVRQTRCLLPASFRFFDERSDKSTTTSRWTPLPWAMRFPLLGLARDLHPLVNAHAERTPKKRDPILLDRVSLYIIEGSYLTSLPMSHLS